MEGWIKLHRKLLSWEWYQDSHTLHLFLHLLLQANHQPTRWRGQIIEQGQVLTGRHLLSKQTGLSEKSIRTSLKRLKTTSEVAIQTTNRFSVITLVKYKEYQINDQQAASKTANKTANKGPAKGHIQECKNEKKEDKILSPRTPLDTFLDSLKENPAYSGIDIDKEVHKMRAWFLTPKGARRKLTHKFILNWLNKCEKDLTPLKEEMPLSPMSEKDKKIIAEGIEKERELEKKWAEKNKKKTEGM